MSDNKITCLACGVFRMEIAALAAQGKLDFDILMLDSMLHMSPAKLEQEMDRVMAAGTDDKFLILYGDCHPRMHEMQSRENASKVSGINCCEILLGRNVYRKLRKDRVFIFLPEWTPRWRDIFVHELGFEKPEVLRAFMKENQKALLYVDTGAAPVPVETLRDISEFFDMPVEVMPISLDTLLQGIHKALRIFTGNLEDSNRPFTKGGPTRFSKPSRSIGMESTDISELPNSPRHDQHDNH